MNPIDEKARAQLFEEARTFNSWKDRPVDADLLVTLYDTLKWGPTCVNGGPARFFFIQSKEAKEKLVTCVLPKNVEKTLSAPVTVIVAEDLNWCDHLSRLMPHADYTSHFRGNDELIKTTSFRNSSLQGAYLILAARALGLDCGPMSGFDNKKLDSLFFPNSSIRSNFLCNLGYGDPKSLFPRSPRLSFEEACSVL